MKRLTILLLIVLTTAHIAVAKPKSPSLWVGSLKVEQMSSPMGIDARRPRLSWIIGSTQNDVRQTAYEIIVASSAEKLAKDEGDIWSSGKVESDEMHAIYPLPPIVHYENDAKKNDDKNKANARNDKEVKPKGKKIFEEYPVRIECDVDFDHLVTFFQSIFEENQVFIFRNIRIESGPTFDSKLRVKAILSALLFN